MILRQLEEKDGEGPRLDHTTRETRAEQRTCVEIFGVGRTLGIVW